MDMTVYRRVVRELGSLHFNVGDPASITAAIQINELIPVVAYSDIKDVHTQWAIDGMHIARAEIEKIAARGLIDKAMTLEMTRQVYVQRCVIANDPLYILFHMLTPVNYKERSEKFGGLMYHDEFVYNQAFYYIVEIMHTNRRDIMTYFADFSYDKSNDVIRNRLVDKIYETFDDNLKKVPPKVMNLYHSIINEVIKDIFVLYRANYKWHRIYLAESHLLIIDQLTNIMDGTIQDHQLTAFVNCFYDKPILEYEYSDREDKALILQVKEDEELILAESDHENFDAESFDAACQKSEAMYEVGNDLLEYFKAEGVCRADAIMVLGLDPVKDYHELAKYPLERVQGDTEVQAFIFKAIRSLGRGLLKIAIRFLEAIINHMLTLFGAPFGLKPRFTLTESSRLVEDWGTNFNKAIHEIIEKEANPFVVDPQTIKNTVVHMMAIIDNYLSFIIDTAEKIDDAKTKALMTSFHESMNSDGLLEINTFEMAVGGKRIFGDILKEYKEGLTYDVQYGSAFIRNAPLNALVNSTDVKRAVQAAAMSTVNKRNLKESTVLALKERLLTIDDYQEIYDELASSVRIINNRIKRLRNEDFDFLDKRNDAKRMFDNDIIQDCRESFKLHVDALRDMGRTANNITEIFHVFSVETTAMIATLNQVKK